MGARDTQSASVMSGGYMQTDPQASVIWRWRGMGQAGAAGRPRAVTRAPSPDRSVARRTINYESIQYLRGISAVMVIFYHAAIQSTALSGIEVQGERYPAQMQKLVNR